jgi:antitoxin CptB
MLGGFVRNHVATLTQAELDDLEALLELPDTDLADWLTGRRPLPPDAAPVLRRIRDSVIR